MTDESLNALLILTKEKKDTLKKILEYTQSKSFKAVEGEIENFQIFLNERSRFFNTIEIIDNKIKNYDIKNVQSSNLVYKEVEKITSDIKSIVKEIIVLDKNNKKIMDELMKKIKENIKSSKVGQQVNKGYAYSNLSFSGSFFDSKQ